MNYHSLSDFRFAHAAFLDALLTESLTALVAEGLVDVTELALDGTKVRASAGKASFAGADKLASLERQMAERVARLKAEATTEPALSEKRRRAAQLRGAEDIAARARRAGAMLEKLRAEKAARAQKHKTEEARKREPRVSVSDPSARMMRFSDGALRSGYNIQLAVAPGSWIIVAAQTTDRRNDSGLVQGMVAQATRRLGQPPARVLADTTYATQADIVALARDAITVYTPVPADREAISAESRRKRAWRRRGEAAALQAWRARMASDEGQACYKRRGAIETVNGILKGRGLGLMRVRSQAKVACVVLLQVLAHNLWRAHCCRRDRAAAIPA